MQKKTKRTQKNKKTKQSRGTGKFLQLFTKSTGKKMKRRVVEICFCFLTGIRTPTLTSACTHIHTYAHIRIHLWIEYENQKLADVPTERTVTQTRTQPQHFTWNMCHVYFAIFWQAQTPKFAQSASSSQGKNKEEEEVTLAGRLRKQKLLQPLQISLTDRELGRKSRTVYGKAEWDAITLLLNPNSALKPEKVTSAWRADSLEGLVMRLWDVVTPAERELQQHWFSTC